MLPTVRSGAWPGPKPVDVGGLTPPTGRPLISSCRPLPGPVVITPTWTHCSGRMVVVVVNALPPSLTVNLSVRPENVSEKPLLVASVDSRVPPCGLAVVRIHTDAVYVALAEELS